MCINEYLMTFFKPIMGKQLETFNLGVGLCILVKVIKSDRICLYYFIMHFKLLLTEKNEMINYKISFVTLIFVFNDC